MLQLSDQMMHQTLSNVQTLFVEAPCVNKGREGSDFWILNLLTYICNVIYKTRLIHYEQY